MGKKRKHEQNGMISMPRDEMPLEEGTSDTFNSSTRDALTQLKDIIQVKKSTDECIQKLEEKVKKLEKKVKGNKSEEVHMEERINKIKEDLKREHKLELQEEMQKFEEKVQKNIKEIFSVFKEDFKKEQGESQKEKEQEEVKEEPYREIQEETQKGGGGVEVNHCSASPSLRSQPYQSQKTSFQLKFACEVDKIVYKGKPIPTIEVVMYDGGNPIAPDHHLASEVVELVVIDGEFIGIGDWSEDQFVRSLLKSKQSNNSKVQVKNSRFKLNGGSCHLKGITIMENSNRKDVKLGVMIVGNTKARVLEGVSNSFRVQEAKTAEKHVKRITDETSDDLTRFTGHNSSHGRNKKGNGSVGPLQGNLYPHQTQQDNTQMGSYGNGPVHRPLVDYLQHQNTTQQGASQQEMHGHVPQQRFQQTYHSSSVVPNQSKELHGHIAGNGPVHPPLVDYLQQQNTTQQGATQQEMHGHVLKQCLQQTDHSSRVVPNQSQQLHDHIAGNGPVHPPLVDYLQQQNTTQQGSTQQEMHGHVLQQRFQQTDHSSRVVSNQSQELHGHIAGNAPVHPPLVDYLQQQNTTQQGATQQEMHETDLHLELSLSKGDDVSSIQMISTSRFAGHSTDHPATPDSRRYFGGIGQLPGPEPQTEDAYQDGGLEYFATEFTGSSYCN